MVGIALLTLVPGALGGSETYARQLVRALARVGRLEYRVYTSVIAPDAADGLPGEVVAGYRAGTTTGGRALAMLEASAFPRRLRQELNADRLSGIHFPLTVMLPRNPGAPAAVTVHDIQHVLYPALFSRSERLYRWAFYRRAALRATLVITGSEHVKQTLVDRWRLEAEQVRVIQHGLDHERFHLAQRERREFLLYPANRWPHKNHERLFRAFDLLRRERPDLRLVLTGYGHERDAVRPGVEVRGRVSTDELVELYQTAACLVFPSLYEGFGLPPLEAMACGCPVAASTAGALPEVCGDAARYFDPTEPEQIAAAVLSTLDEAEQLGERGLARAAGFTWDRSARQHEEVYRELGA